MTLSAADLGNIPRTAATEKMHTTSKTSRVTSALQEGLPMPTPKISLNLLVCAGLTVAAASLCAQSTTGSSAPSSGTPAPQQTSAPAAQQAPESTSTTASNTTANTQPTQDCSGPVLHRAPDKGGDICSPQTTAPVAASDDESTPPPVTGKKRQ